MTKLKRYLGILIALVLVITISNLPPMRYLLDYALDYRHYRYADDSGKFFKVAMNGISGTEGTILGFEDYKIENKLPKDAKLYRLFWRNPLAFWRWHSYLDPAYKMPYKSCQSIPGCKN